MRKGRPRPSPLWLAGVLLAAAIAVGAVGDGPDDPALIGNLISGTGELARSLALPRRGRDGTLDVALRVQLWLQVEQLRSVQGKLQALGSRPVPPDSDTVAVFAELAVALQRTRETLEQAPRLTFKTANVNLVRVSSALAASSTAVPGRYLLAVNPLAIPANSSNRTVTFYATNLNGDATLEALYAPTVSLNGQRVDVHSVGQGAWAFTVPETLPLLAGSTLALTVDPLPSTVAWTRSVTAKALRMVGLGRALAARIYVEKSEPFNFTLRVNGENPGLWATVKAQAPFVVQASGHGISQSRSVPAAELFTQLVPDSAAYVVESAYLVQADAIVASEGKPCSDCPDAVAESHWTPDQFTYSITAPTCAVHLVTPAAPKIPYMCGGGTPSIEVSTAPTFRVKRRNVAEQTVIETRDITMGRQQPARFVELPENWTSVDVLSEFDDGRWQQADEASVSRLRDTAAAGESGAWRAAVDANHLILTTE